MSDVVRDGMTVEEFAEHVNNVHGMALGFQADYNPSRGYHKHLHDTTAFTHDHTFEELRED